MAYFPDFASTARLGFQAGTEIGQGQNPLGQFVRTMLADWQQRRILQGEFTVKKELIAEEGRIKSGITEREEKAKQASPLYQAQVKAYETLAAKRETLSIKEQAVNSLAEGNPLPGLTLDETKKIVMGSSNILEDLISGELTRRGLTSVDITKGAKPKSSIKGDGTVFSIGEERKGYKY